MLRREFDQRAELLRIARCRLFHEDVLSSFDRIHGVLVVEGMGGTCMVIAVNRYGA